TRLAHWTTGAAGYQVRPGLEWILVVLAPTEEFQGVTNDSLFRSTLVGATVLLVAIGLLWFIRRHADAANKRLRSFLESAPDGVLVVDGTGQIALVNHQIEALFGYSRDELLGQPVEILVPERLRGRHVAHRDGFLARPATRPMGRGLELFGQRK